MTSLAKKTKRKREQKASKAGRDRKRKLRIEGSTPKFAIHPDKEQVKEG